MITVKISIYMSRRVYDIFRSNVTIEHLNVTNTRHMTSQWPAASCSTHYTAVGQAKCNSNFAACVWQRNWIASRRTWHCDESRSDCKTASSSGLTICGWARNRQTKKRLSVCCRTNSRPRSLCTFILTRWSGSKSSRTPKPGSCATSFSDCDRCFSHLAISYAEKVRGLSWDTSDKVCLTSTSSCNCSLEQKI